MKNNYYLLLLLCVIICSCNSTYRISKKNKYYSIARNYPDINNCITEHQLSNNISKIKIKEKDDCLIIEGLNDSLFKIEEFSIDTTVSQVKDFREDLIVAQKKDIKVYYYPDPTMLPKKSFRYSSWQANLSLAPISIKNRFKIRKLTDPNIKDSFPSSYSVGINPTFAFGINHSINWYTPSAKKITLEFTIGPFYGFGVTKIDKNTTRESVYTYSRDALHHSLGGFFSIGLQKVNIGVLMGVDIATGPGSPSWVYQKQPFYGFILGYDLVKLNK